MHKNRVAITALLLSSVVTASAQTVSGRITNADTKKPVEFASVLFKESRLYAYTDEKGHFSIHNVPEDRKERTSPVESSESKEILVEAV